MFALLIILVFLFQPGDSPTKWQCAKNCEPPGKDMTLLKGREMTERVVTCETPKLPNLLDAKVGIDLVMRLPFGASGLSANHLRIA
jgi:hypothetical protein